MYFVTRSIKAIANVSMLSENSLYGNIRVAMMSMKREKKKMSHFFACKLMPWWSWCRGARAPTGGVVADVGVGAGAGLVVGEDGGEVGVAARAGEGAGGACGVARLLCAVVPLYEGHVVLHQRHILPHHRAVPRFGLLHPDVLGRTWICQAKKNRKA